MSEKLRPIIELKNLSKEFVLPSEKHSTLKSRVLSLGNKRVNNRLKVLQDISFSVNKGEFLAIVGRNGSGKSTLLKTIAGIYMPNSGSLEIRGRISPFLELGVGFNPELTARENVYLNAAILGLPRHEVDEVFDEIINFAELEQFVDQKLKNFSSGMQVRLAFSVAIRAHAPILLMDEVLAVGDSNFQKKCFSVFQSMKQEGRTLIFVSHDTNSIRRFCDRVIVLHKGEIDFDGPVDDGLQRYEENSRNDTSERLHAEIKDISRESHTRNGIQVIERGLCQGVNNSLVFDQDKGDIELMVDLVSKGKSLKNLNIGFEVNTPTGYTMFFINTKKGGLKPIDLQEGRVKRLEFKFSNFLSEGNYSIAFAVADSTTNEFYFKDEYFMHFNIERSEHSGGLFSPEFNIEVKDNG